MYQLLPSRFSEAFIAISLYLFSYVFLHLILRSEEDNVRHVFIIITSRIPRYTTTDLQVRTKDSPSLRVAAPWTRCNDPLNYA